MALLAAGACASLQNQGRMEQTVGRASYYSIMTEIPEVLAREGYAIYNRRETSRAIYLETSWQERAPFDDEAELGISYARTRFIFRAQLSGPKTYTLRLLVENQVQGELETGWHEAAGAWSTAPRTEMYNEYVREISTEIKLRVDAGMRVYGTDRR